MSMDWIKKLFTFERPLKPLTLQDIKKAEKILEANDISIGELVYIQTALDNAPVPVKGRQLHNGKKVVAVTCEVCGKPCKPQGLKSHIRLAHKSVVKKE